VERNPGQCTVAEYTQIRDAIRERAPCRVLVFGVGRDTPIWIEANGGGRTVFLENLPKWIEHTRRTVPGAEVVRVAFETRRFQWRWLLSRPEKLMLDLPAEILEAAWDVVFVDSPKGKSWKSPGRMQSIYTAAVLARPAGGDVLVHDCNRRVERAYCDAHLADAELVAAVDGLRHYRFRALRPSPPPV
jgi:glucuronoxylan 4-O-methyltransferase